MRASDYCKISRTPAELYAAIPKDAKANLIFRQELHKFLFSDPAAKTDYLAKAFYNPLIFFASSLWTFNPQAKPGKRHIPFIPWPHQEPAILRFKNGIDNEISYLSDKSRKQGATYIILGLFLIYWLMSPESRFLLGSRVEGLVDSGCEIIRGESSEMSTVVGSEESLFYKLLYMLSTLPLYLQPKFYKKHLFLQNLENGAAFKGETTNIGFGKGFRGTATMIDEAAQIEPKLAAWIIENLGATANCNIFNSTVGPWGGAHPYSKLIAEDLAKGGKHVILLDWLSNPTCNYGKYRSPKEGLIEIEDLDYFRRLHPGRFDAYKLKQLIPVADIVDCYPFVADGGIKFKGSWRTVWLDEQEKRPENTTRGICQNILRINSGSTEMFFDNKLLHDLREVARPADFLGDIEYKREDYADSSEITETRIAFGGSDSPLQFWGPLPDRRPNQRHNYTVGCDISRGTGSSNSVAAIKDCNTSETVGLYVNPYIKVSDFAEKAVAICKWVGGQKPAILNWELNNSPEFETRVKELGYYALYVERETAGRKLKRSKKFGWHSSGGVDGSKRKGLNELSASLSEGTQKNPRFDYCRTFDSVLVDELESYVNYEGKVEVGPGYLQSETSGARASHGDRVIGVMLADMASKMQEAADEASLIHIPDNSFMQRMVTTEQKIAAERSEGRTWLF